MLTISRLVRVGLVLALFACGSSRDEGREDASTTTGTPEAAHTPSTGVEMLDPGPLSARRSPAVVWTGSEVVVWGGHIEAFNMGLPGRDRAFADGAAYDPAEHRWRSISAAPLPKSAFVAVGVWTERVVVLFREQEAAAWDPDRDSWRSLPDAPGKPVTSAAWTGGEIVVFPSLAAFDPAEERWRELPEPPVRFADLGQSIARWTGSELLVVGRPAPATGFAGDAVGAAYDPTNNRWRELPPSGLNAQAIDGDWNGRELTVVNYDMSAAAYEPATDQWHALPPVPARFSEWLPTVASLPSQTAVFMAQAVAVRGADDRWTPLPYRDVAGGGSQQWVRPVIAGDVLYSFGFDYKNRKNAFAALDLRAMTARPTTIQVGLVSLTLPTGAELRDADFERSQPFAGLPPAEAVAAVLGGETDGCSVSSTYVGTFGEMALDHATDAASQPVTISPSNGSPPWHWVTGDNSDRRVLRLESSDLIEVACGEPGQARELARYISPPTWPA